MITGDNPLTAVHVAKDVEIVDREVMILDLKEGTTTDGMSHSRHESSVLIPRTRMAKCRGNQIHSRQPCRTV
jgi:cation-transporting ATPase 13A1